MRTHARIIKDAGGALAVHDALALTDKLNMVRSWFQRDRIPAQYWRPLADRGLATLDELATYRASRKVSA